MKTHASLAASILFALALAGAPSPLSAQATVQLVAPPLLVVRGAERPVQVQSLAMSTEVNGGLARTTVEMTFHNPNNRRLEGELQFPLQPGQQVSAFALDVNGAMRAAVPVEKEKGQDVFEAVERRGVDPGLLEQTAGNQFKLRIYPIPANGERRVRIAIDQTLQRDGDGWLLRLPLAFARGIDRVPLRVIARGQGDAPLLADGFAQVALARDGDGFATTINGRSADAVNGLALRFQASRQAQAFVQERDGQRYFHAEVPLPGGSSPRAMPHAIGLLWDSSASGRKRDIDGELAVLDRYFAAVRNGEVRLTRLRDVAEPARSFSIRDGDWSALRKELRATVYDGASALADWKPQADVQEYLLVSDGFSNYGTSEAMPSLAARQRLYALASASADTARLSAWAEARGGRLVSWQGHDGVARAASELTTEGPRVLSIEGSGAEDLVAATRFPDSGFLRIAGRLRQPSATVTLVVDEGGRERRIELPVSSDVPSSGLVAGLWASYRIGELSAEPVLHQAQIRRLGSEFGLVGPDTSLIVLENASDYARYAIAPPPELRDEVARIVAAEGEASSRLRREQMDKVRAEFAEKLAWWQRKWPKDDPRAVNQKKLEAPRERGVRDLAGHAAMPPPPPVIARSPAPMSVPVVPSPPPADAPAQTRARSNASVSLEAAGMAKTLARDEVSVGGNADRNPAGKEDKARNIGIAMQAWKPDSPFARRLRAANPEQVYAIYLDERDDHADSAAFFLDVAGILFERGQRALALRVLSNLAEMNLENRQLLRALGYRLMQAKAYAQAVPVFEHVSRLAGNEPQSWRDLGLAEAAAGREQDAIDNLWRVVTGTWDARFPSIELISLGELDAIVAHARKPLDTHAIDPKLLRNLPLDLRVVLSWDSDNTDIDLWVTDPNGEKTYYSSPHSYQGGWLSHDCTGGYGPEEFILRNAKPGKYKVEANFFGDRQQLITGPTTLQLHLFTGFGTAKEKDQAVTLRLTDAKETILVGTFEVK